MAAGERRFQQPMSFRLQPGHQQFGMGGQMGRADFQQLVGGLAGGEHHLGKPLATDPLMIRFGETQILVGLSLHLSHRRLGGNLPRLQTAQ